MALSDKIFADMKDAMRAHDELRVSTLRFLRSAIKNAEIEVGAGHQASDQEIFVVIQKQMKMRADAAEQFQKAGRAELATKERAESDILAAYLPPALGDDAIREVVRTIIQTTGIQGPSALGAVMKAAMDQLRGQADGKTVQQVAREELAGHHS